MWLMSDLRNFKEAEQMFSGAEDVGSINQSIIIKRKLTEISAYYGLYYNDELIGYFWLLIMRNRQKTYKSCEFHIHNAFKGKGLGTSLFRYMILEEGVTIINDYIHTVISYHIWNKLKSDPRIKYGLYNAIDDTLSYDINMSEDEVYSKDYMHYFVTKNDNN
jgi:hypothetical protein